MARDVREVAGRRAMIAAADVQWLRYVPHGRIVEFLAKGWCISDELHGTNHGDYAVLMVWEGDGEPT